MLDKVIKSDKRVHMLIIFALVATVAMLSYVAANTERFGAAKNTLSARLRSVDGSPALSARLRSVDGSPALAAHLQIQEMGENFRYGVGQQDLSARLRRASEEGFRFIGQGNDKSMVVNAIRPAMRVVNKDNMMNAITNGK